MGLFGKKPQLVNAQYVPPPRPTQTGPSMDEAIHNSEMRTGNIEARIQQVDADILNFKREMQRARPGTSTYNMYKRRALQAMKQKKSLEQRVAMNSNATFNLEQVRDAKYMQEDNIAMVQNIRAANEELRRAQHKVDIDEVEDLQDDMRDALQDAAEVQEILGRSYDVDNIDEAELEAELDELEEDALHYGTGESLSTPSYLQPTQIEPAQKQQAPPQAAGSLPRPGYTQPEQMSAPRY